jgi:hypothetical protein
MMTFDMRFPFGATSVRVPGGRVNPAAPTCLGVRRDARHIPAEPVCDRCDTTRRGGTMRALLLSLPLAMGLNAALANEMEGPLAGTVRCLTSVGGFQNVTPVTGRVANGRLFVRFPDGEASGLVRSAFGRTGFRITGGVTSRRGGVPESIGFDGWFSSDGSAYGRGASSDASCELRLARATIQVPQPAPVPLAPRPRPAPPPIPGGNSAGAPPAPRPAPAPPPAAARPAQPLPDMLACSLAGNCPPTRRP